PRPAEAPRRGSVGGGRSGGFGVEFDGFGDDVDHGAVAQDGDGQGTADRLGEHQPLQRLGLGDRFAAGGQDQVAAAQAGAVGGAAGDDLGDAQRLLASGA